MANIGDVFKLDLRSIFFDWFDDSNRGTPEFGEVRLTYGAVTWVGDGEYPGTGDYDSYDWKIAPFERIPTETGWLELRIEDIDFDEQSITSDVVGWYGLPKLKLSFEEFDEYAQFTE